MNETASISAAERRRFAAIVFVICIGAAPTIVVASEIRKFLLRRDEPAVTAEQAPTESVPA